MGNKQSVGSQDHHNLKGIEGGKKTRPSVGLFDTLNGVFPKHYREIFNALDQTESRVMTWYRRVFDRSAQPQQLQPIPVKLDQNRPFNNISQIEKYGNQQI